MRAAALPAFHDHERMLRYALPSSLFFIFYFKYMLNYCRRNSGAVLNIEEDLGYKPPGYLAPFCMELPVHSRISAFLPQSKDMLVKLS